MSALPPVFSNEEVSTLIHTIYHSVLHADWQPFLQKICDITGSNKAFFYLVDHHSQTPPYTSYRINFAYDLAVVLDFQRRQFEDPGYQITRFETEGTVLDLAQHINFDDYEQTEFYQSIYLPMRSHQMIGAVLLRDDQYDSCFILNRGKYDSRYCQSELDLLTLLTPHLQSALRLFAALQLHQSNSRLSQAVLDQSPQPLLVCSATGNIRLCNKKAQDWLEQNPLLFVQQQQLQFRSPVYQHRLRQLLQQAVGQVQNCSLPASMPVDDAQGQQQALLQFDPLQLQDTELAKEQVVLVTIRLPKVPDWHWLQQQFELSCRQLQLLQALHQSQKLSAMAAQYQISYHTLRSHLQQLFRKFAVNSQTELMLKLSALSDAW